ncbi:hypothetical protein U9M48_043261 [Paspalum notatum var. saurae]|uniref:Reverse transcriptase Ty1/copia-type domain-containing protein n=1 Tax=Paspalum notatum var. saurae TaxID=547442 RepID=A0AAQ3UWM0_PASNO
MPYKAWHGRKPAVSHLRVFGCLAFVKELSHIGMHDDRSTPGVFIGYAEGSKAYRILDPRTQRVRTARDIALEKDEDGHVDDGSTPTYNDFTVEYVHFKRAGGVGNSSSPSMPTPVPELPPTPRLDAYHDGEPLQYRTVESLLGDQPVPRLVPRDLETQLHLACDDGKPCSFAKAERHAAWRTAMQSEMDAELADLPRGHRAITFKWVFKLKRDEVGAIVKHKARLVARGFVQHEGIDFVDAFTPVARMESMRLLLALAARWLHRKASMFITWTSNRLFLTAI